MLVVPDVGELVLLRRMLVPDANDTMPLRIKLYQSDTVPNRESVLADFTEANFAGYTQKDLDQTNWSTPATTAGIAQVTWVPGFISWLATSGTQDIYGYLVTDWTGITLLWAERYPNPVTVSTTVPALVLPTMRLRSESQPAP